MPGDTLGVNPYRSLYCHECRKDSERLKVAMAADSQQKTVVQELKCTGCSGRLAWWHFAKLPLTDDEKIEVIQRGGKAW